MSGLFPIVVLHNVISPNHCSEFVKIASGMGYKTLIITQAQGSAAQRGVPTAQKLALKAGINFMALNDLKDIEELFQPDVKIVVAPPPYGKITIDADYITKNKDRRYVVIFGGNDPGLSRKDLEFGDDIIQIPAGDLGSIGTLTLGLALLTGKFKFARDE